MPAAQAGPIYNLVPLPGCPPCGVNGINNAGVTTGITPGTAAFIDNGGILTKFDFPGAMFTDANGINDAGVVAGDYFSADGNDHPLIRQANGTFLTPPSPLANATAAWFGDVNNSGVFVASATTDPNQQTGYMPFLFNGSTYTPLTLPFANVTSAIARNLNNSGTVVGPYTTSAGGFQAGYELFSNGSAISLSYPGSTRTYALGINDSGEVVGGYFDSSGVQHGFLLNNGIWTTIDFVDANHDPNTKIEEINDLGQIVGFAFSNDFSSQESFIGTPVPEPGTLGMAGLAAVLALCIRLTRVFLLSKT